MACVIPKFGVIYRFTTLSSSFEFLREFRDDVRSASAKMAGHGHRKRRFLQHESNGTYLGIFRTCNGFYPHSVYKEGRICSSSPSTTPLTLLPGL